MMFVDFFGSFIRRCSKPPAMLPSAWIYILTNINHFVLYTGVTTNLRSRLYEHSTGQSRKSFTFRYSVSKLVYYEGFETVKEAIRREKYIKGKSRVERRADQFQESRMAGSKG